MKKTFVLDTNVLLHNSKCIESFADNVVVLPMAVIEELDKFKGNNDELGRNARQVIRNLDRLRKRGRLGEGVPMENGGILRIITDRDMPRDTGLDEEVIDNKIIRVAYHLKKTGQRVIFVSKDINARLKSDALGIETMDFEKQKVNFDELFTGYRMVRVPRKQLDEFNQAGRLRLPDLEIFPNEFIVLTAEDDEKAPTQHSRDQISSPLAGEDKGEGDKIDGRSTPSPLPAVLRPALQAGQPSPVKGEGNNRDTSSRENISLNVSHTVLARATESGELIPLSSERNSAWNIKARSKEQRMALELLLDDTVSLVTLVGQAGTGKTLLALAAGLEQTLKVKRYDKMLVSRPIMPLGKDIGFLPGDKETKLQNWMQPIFDNLAYLMRATGDPKHSIREKIERLQREHVVELEALTYIRGRSIPKQYVIIDEAQNLTPHEVKTIISRSGEGTKMVLTGDPSQIDNPYLDSNSNGLTYTVERMKPVALHGHVTLMKSERSVLAATAADLL